MREDMHQQLLMQAFGCQSEGVQGMREDVQKTL